MRKRTENIKALIATMGPGETVQGIALSKYLKKKGIKVVFTTRLELNQKFLKKAFLAETSEDFKKIYDKEKPDILILCNSKIHWYYKDFLQNPPFPKPVTVCLDSNWLFRKRATWYSFPEWADKYLIVFPKSIFKAGLEHYAVPKQAMEKIETIGFIPSYKRPSSKQRKAIRNKYGIKKSEKLIFAYFSGFGAGFRFWAFEHLIQAVDKLREQGRNIKVLYVGPSKDLPKRGWLIRKEILTGNEFFLGLTSSDLLFQHQGLGTLAQAVSSRTPVITNVKDVEEENFKDTAHAWEVGPFDKLGLCKMFYKSSKVEDIAKSIENLLYNRKTINKMKKSQKKHYIPGEPNAYKIIKKLWQKN